MTSLIYSSMTESVKSVDAELCQDDGHELHDVEEQMAWNSLIATQRIFVAVDLHDNQDTISTFIRELIKFVATIPPEKIFISIYESGSADATPAFVQLLKGMLKMMKISHEITSNSSHTKVSNQHRIDFLSTLRNAALEPLFRHNGEPEKWYDQVVFLNDVIFCAKDIKKLLLYRADMACGLDYDKVSGRFGFYDTWVARDINGRPFTKEPGYVQDENSAARLSKGLPINVHCCWNGLAVLNAEPFHRGLRFRTAKVGECSASECSLLCKDLSFNGYNRKVVDPMVRLAYTLNDFKGVRPRGPGIGSREFMRLFKVPEGKNAAAVRRDGKRISSATSSNYINSKDASAEMAIDGMAETLWRANPATTNPWFQVDLGALVKVRSMKLVWEIGCASGYTISSSADGQTWDTVFGAEIKPECNGHSKRLLK
eukprot:gene10867-12863_t